MSVVHGCPPSAIGPSLLLLPMLRTVCPTCHVHILIGLCLFSYRSPQGVPSHDFYRNFSRHFRARKSFLLGFLLRYLLAWSVVSIRLHKHLNVWSMKQAEHLDLCLGELFVAAVRWRSVDVLARRSLFELWLLLQHRLHRVALSVRHHL